MSFYDTQNLPNFTVQDPITRLTESVAILQEGIVQPAVATINSTVDVNYTAAQVLSGCINRTGATPGNVTDTFPSAASIIDEMSRILNKIKGYPVTIKVGDYFPLTIVNNTPNDVEFNSGVGITNDFSTVQSGYALRAQLVVTNTNPATIYIDNL